ncbi:hypothetical protein BO99DRAFT_477879 [Aspergillus violaceofuscus CBS 115571]|uniref:Uncharacterized protein n=1 Tax=Aspergillus violaceofuscus (strain CBS 115571) TaxID=1450538 RepID=A0A2V5GQ60_ASPV1|nr:hypothetical protein BO99DRAFT_477879 [Aspergillus violaceofuscus CBS 115571]
MMNQEETRSLIASQIQHTMDQFFQTTTPTRFRLVGDTPTAILDSEDYLLSRHSYFVVDVNNVDYDYETAHEVTTSIPVYVIGLSRRVKITRNPTEDKNLAWILATMHRGHGNDPLPLVDDYTRPVVITVWSQQRRGLDSVGTASQPQQIGVELGAEGGRRQFRLLSK